MLWPRQLLSLPNGDDLYLYKLPDQYNKLGLIRHDHVYLFHRYRFNSDTYTKISAFGSTEMAGDMDEMGIYKFAQLSPGKFTLATDQRIFYAPSLYDGVIYYADYDDGYSVFRSIDNPINIEKPFQLLKSNPDSLLRDRAIMFKGNGIESGIIVKSLTMGLYNYDRYIIHHYVLNEETGISIQAGIYSASGKFLARQSITNYFPGTSGRPLWDTDHVVLWAEDDLIYTVKSDRNGYYIIVYKINMIINEQ